ncbi:hypothetical protein [Haloarchaeobius sp. DYHT-AS-18]|uniref:hypothetical protein n=2 Tax=unclassified Haloarchaeobius TaxID=2614452 RepID=UPI003EBD3908
MKKRTYEVFGRIRAGEPLQSVGAVDAPNDSFATRYAEMFYDEEDWDVLFAVDRRNMLKVKGDTGHEYEDTGNVDKGTSVTAVAGEKR